MAARGDNGWTQPAFADGPVDRLLAHAEEARGLPRADEVRLSGPTPSQGCQTFDVLRLEAAVAPRSDHCRPQQPSRHGTENGRPAHAKASC